MVSMRATVVAFLWSTQRPLLVLERFQHRQPWRSVSASRTDVVSTCIIM